MSSTKEVGREIFCENGLVTDFHPDRHRYGDAAAQVRIVEYGDFQCPGCKMLAPVLKELVDESGGRIYLVFRHFPVFEVHPFALTAALAAEASGSRFWEMHEQLFAHQDNLDDENLAECARRAGVVGAVTGLEAQQYKAGVSADYTLGIDEGVRATPGLFINGSRYEGSFALKALREATVDR